MNGFLLALVTRKAIGSVVRHGMTVLGGYLVASGTLDADTVGGTDWQAIQGGAVAAAGLLWSLVEKGARIAG